MIVHKFGQSMVDKTLALDQIITQGLMTNVLSESLESSEIINQILRTHYETYK